MNLGTVTNTLKKLSIALAICAGSWLHPGAACSALTGDCDGDSAVGIAEVQSAINMYLGLKPVASCVDADGNATVTIAEVQQSVNGFLGLAVAVSARPVTGVVSDPVNGNAPAAGAVVRAYQNGTSATPAATATVQANGGFSLTGLSEGRGYYLVFSQTGYGDVSYYGVNPSLAADTVLEPVLLLPVAALGQTAAVNGYVKNAADNKGLPYVTLMFRAGIGATSGDLVPQTKSTDSTGYWSRGYFPAGCYTAQVISSDGSTQTTLGYFTVYSVPGVGAYNNSQNCAVATGSGQADSYRAVLSWGSTPQALDLHLTGPLAPGDTTTTIGADDTPRFHIDSTQTVYPYESGVPYSSPTITGAATDAYLDIDQADHGKDNGSETMTILAQRTGLYRFYVYNNSASGTLSGSGAQVKLYKGATLLQSFPVPAQAGNTWHVFDLEGETVSPINTMSSVDADQTYNLARTAPGAPLDELRLFRPIVKTITPR